MGSATDDMCSNCQYEASFVTADFDYGFMGKVTTPVVCPEHGIVQADTGLSTREEGWQAERRQSYPCPTCARESPLWDRTTCPRCGQPAMGFPPTRRLINWD